MKQIIAPLSIVFLNSPSLAAAHVPTSVEDGVASCSEIAALEREGSAGTTIMETYVSTFLLVATIALPEARREAVKKLIDIKSTSKFIFRYCAQYPFADQSEAITAALCLNVPGARWIGNKCYHDEFPEERSLPDPKDPLSSLSDGAKIIPLPLPGQN